VVWIIVAVCLVAAFGPIFWLMPSRRDRRLAKLRQAARRRGLAVELVRVPLLDPTPEDRVSAGGARRDAAQPGAAYRLPMAPGSEGAPSWFLLRGQAAGSPVTGWAPHPRRRAERLPADAATYWQAVADALEAVKTPVLAVEATPAATSWHWREDMPPEALDDAVDEIAKCLGTIGALQAAAGGRD